MKIAKICLSFYTGYLGNIIPNARMLGGVTKSYNDFIKTMKR